MEITNESNKFNKLLLNRNKKIIRQRWLSHFAYKQDIKIHKNQKGKSIKNADTERWNSYSCMRRMVWIYVKIKKYFLLPTTPLSLSQITKPDFLGLFFSVFFFLRKGSKLIYIEFLQCTEGTHITLLNPQNKTYKVLLLRSTVNDNIIVSTLQELSNKIFPKILMR